MSKKHTFHLNTDHCFEHSSLLSLCVQKIFIFNKTIQWNNCKTCSPLSNVHAKSSNWHDSVIHTVLTLTQKRIRLEFIDKLAAEAAAGQHKVNKDN